jgi:hypothetical protein
MPILQAAARFFESRFAVKRTRFVVGNDLVADELTFEDPGVRLSGRITL